MTGRTFEQVMPAIERPVALVVEASFDSERFTIDTTTIGGQRVVVMQQKDGVRYLTAAETLALSRALLSRLAYVGFPEIAPPAGACAEHVGGGYGWLASCAACCEALKVRQAWNRERAGVAE